MDGEVTSARVDYPRRHDDFSGEDTPVMGHRIIRGITVLTPLSQGVFRPFLNALQLVLRQSVSQRQTIIECPYHLSLSYLDLLCLNRPAEESGLGNGREKYGESHGIIGATKIPLMEKSW